MENLNCVQLLTKHESFFFFLIHFNPFLSICKYSNGEKNPIFLANDINDQLKIDIFSNMAVMVT